MFWFILIIGIVFLLLFTLLVSVFEIEVDTRVPRAGIRWGFLGKALIWYDEDWWLKMQFPLFQKTIRVANIKMKSAKKENEITNQGSKKRMKVKNLFKKIFRILNTFQVIEWKLSIDTGDNITTAQIFPLNFFPKTYNHIFINFRNENFLLLKIRNYPWKILYAYLK